MSWEFKPGAQVNVPREQTLPRKSKHTTPTPPPAVPSPPGWIPREQRVIHPRIPRYIPPVPRSPSPTSQSCKYSRKCVISATKVVDPQQVLGTNRPIPRPILGRGEYLSDKKREEIYKKRREEWDNKLENKRDEAYSKNKDDADKKKLNEVHNKNVEETHSKKEVCGEKKEEVDKKIDETLEFFPRTNRSN